MKIPNPLSLIVFGLLGVICACIGFYLMFYEGLMPAALLMGIIACICVLIGFWSNSDFKKWK